MINVELLSGIQVLLNKREYQLLRKMMAHNETKFSRNNLSPRAQVLADNLVSNHILNRDDDYYYMRKFTIIRD